MPNSSNKPNILLVDDTETNRYVLGRHLRRAGYEVIEAGTGEEALRQAQRRPDLIILDVKLPDISGLEVSRRVRSNPETRLIPILQISATFTMSGDKVKGLDAGADGYLTGPVEPEELLANVRMLLRLREAQEALARSNARLNSVLSSILDVFFAVDFQLRFLELNPAAEKLFGRPAAELVGKSFPGEYAQVKDTEFARRYEQAARDRQPAHFEAASAIAPGTWWEAHIYPREDRLDFYLRDITERKQYEARLRTQLDQLRAAQAELAGARDQLSAQNERLEDRVRERTARLEETVSDLETFSYSITHDMRAPLRAMQGFSQMLVELYSHKLDAEGRELLERIGRSANRLDLLIRDVLTYSRIARAQLKLVPVNVEKLLDDILRDYPGFQPPHAEIVLRKPLPPVLGNEAFLTQCFSNLLGNAVKFVKEGTRPRVEVTAQAENGRVRIEFKDNGIGIPSEHQRRLFTLFSRAQTKYPGTGVGLAVVRKAVERLGGRVGLNSAAGRGSTFWLELQAAEARNS